MRSWTVLAALAAVLSIGGPSWTDEEEGGEQGWPREYSSAKGSIILYQPQVERWDDFALLFARAAASVKKAGSEEEHIGAFTFRADTLTDEDQRMVVIDHIQVTDANFPDLTEEQEARLLKAASDLFPRGPVTHSMDRLLSAMAREQIMTREVGKLATKPPKVIVSDKEAILLVLDGDPVLERVDETDLMVVVNSPSAIYRHIKRSRFYLLVDDSWLSSAELKGPWAKVTTLPGDFRKLPNTEYFAEAKKHVPGAKWKEDTPPEVHLADKEPTELIVIYGKPKLADITGTKLRYVTNTESDVFFYPTNKNIYYLVAGRWFKTQNIEDGPWTFASEDLPEDFQKIPEDHTCGRVLVAVPGTDQAEEAIIASQIPRTAKVKRREAKIEVTYDGRPEFEKIEGTKVSYAVNTSLDVFRVERKGYFCCYEGVWFGADTAYGPWRVCDKVPEEIYEIPAESEQYPVTYVYTYWSDPEYVYVGYYPGYRGCYYWHGGVYYGTGIWHLRARRYWRHWYNHWRPRPTPYRGWRPRPTPYNAWRHRTHGFARHYDHMSRRYRRSEIARRHHHYKGANRGVYSNWKKGVTRTHVARAGQRGKATAKPVTRRKNNVYAGKSGNVYRRNANGTWDKKVNGKWQRATLSRQPRKTQTSSQITRTSQHRSSAHRRTTTSKRNYSSQQRSMHRSTRSRTSGAQRSTQYRGYRSSYGARTSSSRARTSRSRGGGSRGGGRGGGRR